MQLSGRNLAGALRSRLEGGIVTQPSSQIWRSFTMQARLTYNWTAIALRGVVAIAFGILALLLPGLTLAVLILLFAAYALVDGVSHVITGIRQQAGGRPDWLMIAAGILAIVAGIIAAVLPGITALALLTLIGAWVIVTGVMEVAAAYRLRKEISGEWLLALDGIVSIVFGIYLWVFPGAGAMTLVWLIAFYAIFSGVMLLALAWRMRSLDQRGGSYRAGASAA
jgi:uncharacterized membrane protein HdeD (DUF308 family)